MKETAFFYRALAKTRRIASRVNRARVVEKLRAQNGVQAVSVISSNCIGCLLLHDLGLRFDSPTVNLYFTAEDYIRFVENLKHYLSVPLTAVKMDDERGYPVGDLEGLTLYFVHYKSCEEAIQKWETRKARVDFDNLFLIFTDRNGMTDALLARYLALPYPKVVFVADKKRVLSEECIYVPGFEDNGHVCEMDKFADFSGHRYYEKYGDIVGRLNGRGGAKQ